jgi:hypothetical protein
LKSSVRTRSSSRPYARPVTAWCLPALEAARLRR